MVRACTISMYVEAALNSGELLCNRTSSADPQNEPDQKVFSDHVRSIASASIIAGGLVTIRDLCQTSGGCGAPQAHHCNLPNSTGHRPNLADFGQLIHGHRQGPQARRKTPTFELHFPPHWPHGRRGEFAPIAPRSKCRVISAHRPAKLQQLWPTPAKFGRLRSAEALTSL